MSVAKRGGVYWYEFVIDGVRHRGSTKVANKDKARDIEAAVRLDIVNGHFGIKKREPAPTFADFYPEVVTRLKNKADGQHPRTIENAEHLGDRLARFKPLYNAKLDQINDELLSRFVTWHRSALTPHKAKYSSGSINKSLATIRATLRLAIDREKISRAPNVSKYMLPERSREFVLTGQLRDEFVGGLPEPGRTVVLFLLDTGLRISECCDLTWDRVLYDESRDLMYVYIDRGKSKKAKRYVLLLPGARAIIEKQRTISRSNFVFVRLGERVDREMWYKAPLSRHTITHQFKRRRKEMGLPDDAVLHSTRHSFLTELGASGADAFSIKAVAGHASVTTSEGYIHPVSDGIIRVMERLTETRERDKAASKARLEAVGNGNPSKVPTNSPTVGRRMLKAVGK